MILHSTLKKRPVQTKLHQNKNMLEVRTKFDLFFYPLVFFFRFIFKKNHYFIIECIVYTWDYHTSESIWNGLKVAPILADEIQTFKALITVHKVIRGGHPTVSNFFLIYQF